MKGASEFGETAGIGAGPQLPPSSSKVVSNGSRRLLLRWWAAPPLKLPCVLQAAGGSCSQGETEAKEGWRPSCLPILPQHLGPLAQCAVYLRSRCFPLLGPGRQYQLWDSTFQQAGNAGWRSCISSSRDLPQTSLAKPDSRRDNLKTATAPVALSGL